MADEFTIIDHKDAMVGMRRGEVAPWQGCDNIGRPDCVQERACDFPCGISGSNVDPHSQSSLGCATIAAIWRWLRCPLESKAENCP
jgi:hypothetical protein